MAPPLRELAERFAPSIRRRLTADHARSLTSPVRPVKHYGGGGIRHNVVWFRNTADLRAQVRRRRTPGHAEMLVGQNHLDAEFVDFTGPKVFVTFEARPHMAPGTLEILDSGEIDGFFLSYADPDVTERMCYPGLTVDPVATAAGLEACLDERRPGSVCLVNRFVGPRPGTLHGARLDVVAALGDAVDLYGRPAWDDGRVWDHPNYRGVSRDKLSTLRSYTFNVCFENSDHPGYVTEKLLDAIAAGCVPLYRGGGGLVGDVVPRDCFVDCAGLDGDGVAELVRTTGFDRVREYRRAGVDFLRSDAAVRFTEADYWRRVARRLEAQDR